MIPIAVEPSRLMFDHESISSDFLQHFKEFALRLDELFALFKQNSLGIAVTKELYSLLSASVPVSAYAIPSVQKIARELYTIHFLKTAQVVHSYGGHDFDLTFQQTEIQNRYLLDTEGYQHWVDMLGLGFQEKLIRIILRNHGLSIFLGLRANLLNQDNGLCEYRITENIGDITSSADYAFSRLHLIFTTKCNKGSSICNCSGTGDHSSMWGPSINCLNDIPMPERELLSTMIKTKMVDRMTLLTFDKQAEASDPPYLRIVELTEGDCSDMLHCTLYGRGHKQNCQDLAVYIDKGTGKYFVNAFPKGIRLESLNRLIAA